MSDKIFHINTHVFLFNYLSVVVLVWLRITASISLPVAVAARGEGGGSNYKCIDKERESLLDIKAHLEDPVGLLSTWKPEEDEDCCKWHGVTCNNHTGHITELVLSGDGPGLVGEISPSLSNLAYLNLLYLSGHSFNGTIPMSIGSLTKLRFLAMTYNSFTGKIPSSIGSLTELRYLDLSGNSHLNGTVPAELGNLTNLEYLSLESLESCTIENLDWLSHLSQLQSLSMDGSSLAKANYWVNAILSLHKLSELSLYGCNLSQVMHPYSSSLNSSSSSSSSSIVDLNLRDNNLNSTMYHWLFPLTSDKLQALDLSENKLDEIPKYLGNLCSLETLYLSGNSLVVKFPDFLSNLSGCTSAALQDLYASFNQFTGSLPDEIQMFSSLKYLALNYNQLDGTISEKVWELPKLNSLDVSSNFLRGAISENIGKSKLQNIYLSNNSLQGVPPKSHMSNLSYVKYIDLSSCKELGPRFPNWIQALKNLTHLDIANTGISDTIPVEFWNMWPSRLTYLNLSSNNITGMVSDLLSNFDPEYSRIDLSSNNFYGLIPDVSSSLTMLDLSKNKFSGRISFLCHITDGILSYLDLSNNSLTGQIPNCLWNFKELIVLNLGYNNFFGSLPPSIESLIKLEVLYINDNFLSGELPFSLKNCTDLVFLHLGYNKFSGDVPSWIGENLSGLYALSLASNNFFGTIPLQLCQLVNLQILDLSMNNINGTIPSCVTNLTAMVQDGFSPNRNEHHYIWHRDDMVSYEGEYLDHAKIKWQGSVRELMSTLGLVKIINLSSNNLTGQIPYELTNLQELLALDLSNNTLHGNIPQQIGKMKKLLTLDLSRNNLSGGIPSSLSQVTSLNDLNVSYNMLSGRIPSGTQLQSFEPSRYIGNEGLCGPPVTKYCPGDEELKIPQVIAQSEDGVEDVDELQRWFYIGGATGFAIGFWTVCSILLLYRRGRHAFAHFQGSFENWVYVKVMVFIAKTQAIVYT